MRDDFFFHEQLGRIGLRSNFQWSVFPNLFVDGTARLITGLELNRYICATHDNWDNYEPEDKFAAGDEKDEESEDIEGSPGDQYTLYSVYN